MMKYTSRGFRALMYGCCIASLAVGADNAAFAATGNASGMTVAPLADDFGGRVPAGSGPTAGLTAGPGAGQRQYRDGTVLAYLIELARKQDRPCPSGVTPPAPPALTFSEPLCRVAEAVAKGEDVRAAMAGQGLYATRWRTFSAGDSPAPVVANSLREKHCEALLEPQTHIGVVHGPAGWSVVMAELTARPSVEEGAAASLEGSTAEPGAAGAAAGSGIIPAAAAAAPASAPVPAIANSPAAGGATAPLPGEAEVPGLVAQPSEPDKVPGDVEQEARKLFMRINAQREKGGSCLGRAASPVPPLAFDPVLQSAAELAATEMAAKGVTDRTRGTSGAIAGTGAYTGGQVTELTAKTGASASASAIVDIWMLNPNDCGVLFSPLFTDAGVAHIGGNWVVLLGAKGKGVPSPEPGQPGYAAPSR